MELRRIHAPAYTVNYLYIPKLGIDLKLVRADL